MEYATKDGMESSLDNFSVCISCGKTLPKGRSYCNQHCKNEHDYKVYIEKWKNGEVDGMRGATAISRNLRRYIFEKYDNKCAKCGWSERNQTSGNIPLEVEHIDGDHTNNSEDNLILLCPNCHSLTPTYKSLNKGRGGNRAKYNERYKKRRDGGMV